MLLKKKKNVNLLVNVISRECSCNVAKRKHYLHGIFIFTNENNFSMVITSKSERAEIKLIFSHSVE